MGAYCRDLPVRMNSSIYISLNFQLGAVKGLNTPDIDMLAGENSGEKKQNLCIAQTVY